MHLNTAIVQQVTLQQFRHAVAKCVNVHTEVCDVIVCVCVCVCVCMCVCVCVCVFVCVCVCVCVWCMCVVCVCVLNLVKGFGR